MGSTATRVKRLRKERGRPLRPPPSRTGFWAAKTRKEGGQRKTCARKRQRQPRTQKAQALSGSRQPHLSLCNVSAVRQRCRRFRIYYLIPTCIIIDRQAQLNESDVVQGAYRVQLGHVHLAPVIQQRVEALKHGLRC